MKPYNCCDSMETIPMMAGDIDDVRGYSQRLRRYSAEELEDIYFNIHILRHPLRYRLIRMEMERRRLQPSPATVPTRRLDLGTWLNRRTWLSRRPVLTSILLSLLLFAVTSGATLLMLLPIWIFAVPLHFDGLQTALVYFATAPVPFVLGAGLGGRLGGRGLYSLPVLLGGLAAALAFNATGAPGIILHSIVQPQGSGGFQIGGF